MAFSFKRGEASPPPILNKEDLFAMEFLKASGVASGKYFELDAPEAMSRARWGYCTND